MAGMNRRNFLLRFAAAATATWLGSRRARASARPDSSSRLGAADAIAGPHAREMDVALIAAAGDTTLGSNLQDHFDLRAADGFSRELLFPLYFSGLKPVLDWADLAMVNLECPFTERGTALVKNFTFRARPELVQILKEGSVDAVTLANNHLMDYGADGLADTIDTLDQAGILHFGAG